MGRGITSKFTLKRAEMQIKKCLVYSRLFQYSNNMTILCIWAWERFRPSVWKQLQERNEKEKAVLDVQFSTDKKARNNAGPPDTAQFRWEARLSVLVPNPTFGCFYLISRKQRCLLKLYMLVKSARRVSRELHWGNVSTLGLLHG